MARWKSRVANNCLFIDEVESGRIVLQHNARPGLRPYIHPLRGVDGQACLTEDSPWHHPWQHGIQTGFHGVNGCDFWFDPGQNAKAVIGTIEPSTPEVLGEDPPRWSIEAKWCHEDGRELLHEKQTWMLSDGDEVLYLDLDWEVAAVPDVTIEQGQYGGFFIRMPFRSDREAKVVSSSGLEDDATEQQPAAVAVVVMEPAQALEAPEARDWRVHRDHPQPWSVPG